MRISYQASVVFSGQLWYTVILSSVTNIDLGNYLDLSDHLDVGDSIGFCEYYKMR